MSKKPRSGRAVGKGRRRPNPKKRAALKTTRKPAPSHHKKASEPFTPGHKPGATPRKLHLRASAQKPPPIPRQKRGESAEVFVQRLYEREALLRGFDPQLQRLMVQVKRPDGAIAQYSVSTYLAYVEKKRYKRPRQKGLSMTIGYDLGPGNFVPLRNAREVPLGKKGRKR